MRHTVRSAYRALARVTRTGIAACLLASGIQLAAPTAAVAVDPGLLTAAQKVLASDGQAGDTLGFECDIEGDTAVVGARCEDQNGPDAGAAYIFVRDGGTWVEQQKLVASDGLAYDYFAHDVAISGDTVIISAHTDDKLGFDTGAAYIFTRSGTTWTQQQKLQSSLPQIQEYFGYSVSIDGDTAVIGAYGSGSAYVFTRSGTTWTEQQRLEGWWVGENFG
ncbi:MAG: hypothetical protein FDZ70_10105, partial [Actinobacteria bacterium]